MASENSCTQNFVEEDLEKCNSIRKKWCGFKRTMVILVVVVFAVSNFATMIYVFGNKQSTFNRDAINIDSGSSSAPSRQTADAAMSRLFLSIGSGHLFQLQECQGTQYKVTFPDIDYALMGYNVLRGYPLATGHDPGFTLPIFTADYKNGVQTADCRYNVPKGLVVAPDVSCVTSFSSKVVQTSYEYAQSLSVSASVNGGGWGVSFSASAGYKESSSEMASGESVFIISTAKCNYYFTKLVQRSPPPFNPDFFQWILRLNNTDNTDIYIEFFETYGTHFATEVKFGARFTYEHKMKSETFQSQSEKGIDVGVSASYSGAVSAGASFSMEYSQKEKASDFSKSVETKTITVGAAPPANGDAMTWASTVKESPVPSEYKLESIEELFTERYMDKTKVNVNLEKISQTIRKYKSVYCEYLLAKGDIESCQALTPGLMLSKTRLYAHYAEHILSYKECVDYCLRQMECSAVTYCDKCSSSDVHHKTCYLYKKDTRFEIAAGNEKEWKSLFFVGKVNANLVLHNTTVVGIARKYQLKKGETIDELKCHIMCVQDVHCVVYSYCVCPGIDQKCTLYSIENVLGFKVEEGTMSVFVTKHTF
ncbi:uncharacterized protein LOC132719697 isoform X2 [Ruditapes philippinarum]|uniref:uncharacterized protein LOC132719697 isoform X2 n=1 Tax=Ruditapes philippinarum TaxID=129788 RepID=UPI00295B7D16|nr:uncharacterized protein LOC132719697 isoform X2 [Ruditapes philippinarum]